MPTEVQTIPKFDLFWTLNVSETDLKGIHTTLCTFSFPYTALFSRLNVTLLDGISVSFSLVTRYRHGKTRIASQPLCTNYHSNWAWSGFLKMPLHHQPHQTCSGLKVRNNFWIFMAFHSFGYWRFYSQVLFQTGNFTI